MFVLECYHAWYLQETVDELACGDGGNPLKGLASSIAITEEALVYFIYVVYKVGLMLVQVSLS